MNKNENIEPNGGLTASAEGLRKAAFRARFGVTVALTVGMTSLGLATFSYFSSLRSYLWYAASGLLGLGLLLCCIRPKRAASELTEDAILRFYANPRYWSFVTILTTALTCSLCLILFAERRTVPAPVAQTPKIEIPKPPPEPLPPEAPAPLPPEFPSLEVSGLVFNGTNSSAVINRFNLHLGESVEGVELVEILPDSIVVEMEGHRKTIRLGSGSDHLPLRTEVAIRNPNNRPSK